MSKLAQHRSTEEEQKIYFYPYRMYSIYSQDLFPVSLNSGLRKKKYVRAAWVGGLLTAILLLHCKDSIVVLTIDWLLLRDV